MELTVRKSSVDLVGMATTVEIRVAAADSVADSGPTLRLPTRATAYFAPPDVVTPQNRINRWWL